MFYRQKRPYHTHGLFFLLSVIAAFFLGRKSHEYGYTIVSKGCGSSESDKPMDMMNDQGTGGYN
jgi:hypothetical protein